MNPARLISISTQLALSSDDTPEHQDDLRRAVSTAYYAMFHALANSNANALIGAPHKQHRQHGLEPHIPRPGTRRRQKQIPPHRTHGAFSRMKVSTILDHIESGNMALPEFQRGYVWTRGQVRDLMDSMYRKHPVGSLLVWAGEAAPGLPGAA